MRLGHYLLLTRSELRGGAEAEIMEAEVAKPIIKVAAICGSLRKGSFNRGLIRSAIEISKQSVTGMEIEYVDISALPMINTDLEVDGKYPPVVEAFRRKIVAADSILFASPEYNFSVTPPLKNAIDWASRAPNVWADKAAAIVSAAGSLGGSRAQYHYRQIGVYLDLHFINKPEFFLNAYQPPAKFDSDGNLIDPAAKERLTEVLLALQAFSLRLKGCNNDHLGVQTIGISKQNGGCIVERSIFRTLRKEDLWESFDTSIDYRQGRRAEASGWDELEDYNRRTRAGSWHSKFKHMKDAHVEMERIYKIGLAASWMLTIFMILLYMLDRYDGTLCSRKPFYSGLKLVFP